MRISIVVAIAGLCILPIASGQIIPIKTVPLATGNQFSIFPSTNLASGGISVAADDRLSDPFTNPAKGYSVDGMLVLSAPQLYSVSIDRSTSEGSGISLPLGILARKGNFFGGLYWARQQLSSESHSIPGVTPALSATVAGIPNDPENNTYTFATLGTAIPEADLAVGASAFWGELNSVEGVDLLFPRSPQVLQNGTVAEYRVSATRMMEGNQEIGVVVVRSVFKMRYDVAASVPTGTLQSSSLQFNPEYDQTKVWGLQLRYTRPLGGPWRAGALLTTNWKDHPKIPNYDLMSIPRDPGNSTAYNLGIGLFRSQEYSFFGVDLIYEPIETETWAEAEQPIMIHYGRFFPAGMKTVENYFTFSNWIGRIGFRSGFERSAFQFGLQFHTINYDLEQFNNVLGSKRNQHEHWIEWTLSGGYGFSVGPMRLLYTVLLTAGTGQPSATSPVFTGWPAGARSGVSAAFDGADFLPAPGGSLSVRKGLVWTHMVSASYEIE